MVFITQVEGMAHKSTGSERTQEDIFHQSTGSKRTREDIFHLSSFLDTSYQFCFFYAKKFYKKFTTNFRRKLRENDQQKERGMPGFLY